MEDCFKFKLGIGRHPWNASEVVFEVEISRELHDQVADDISTGKMARLEFGFRFQQIVEERFPELAVAIRQTIEQWLDCHKVDDKNVWASVNYSLQSSWFEE